MGVMEGEVEVGWEMVTSPWGDGGRLGWEVVTSPWGAAEARVGGGHIPMGCSRGHGGRWGGVGGEVEQNYTSSN